MDYIFIGVFMGLLFIGLYYVVGSRYWHLEQKDRQRITDQYYDLRFDQLSRKVEKLSSRVDEYEYQRRDPTYVIDELEL